LGIGFGLGTLTAKLVLYLRQTHREAVGLDNFLALGLIATAYGVALLLHAYGFLAVFAAGLAIRHEEMRRVGGGTPAPAPPPSSAHEQPETAFNPDTAPKYMADAVLSFTEQVDRLLEVAAVVVLGALLATTRLTWDAVVLAVLLFVLIRPLSVLVGVFGMPGQAVRRWLTGWFGVRGIGSLYYLMFAIGQGLPEELARRLSGLVVWTVALSVVVHGVSVTPLMDWYSSRKKRRR
jgi:NhaP-type Na+/H+ or K+/H+ antiporter